MNVHKSKPRKMTSIWLNVSTWHIADYGYRNFYFLFLFKFPLFVFISAKKRSFIITFEYNM